MNEIFDKEKALLSFKEQYPLEGKSIRVLGEEFGVTHERIRQILLLIPGYDPKSVRAKIPRRAWEERECPQCHQKFSVFHSQKKKFCSRKCWYDSRPQLSEGNLVAYRNRKMKEWWAGMKDKSPHLLQALVHLRNKKISVSYKDLITPMDIKTPKGWRKGQTIFNFLWFLQRKGYVKEFGTTGGRMADPFHISDKDLDILYSEFLNETNA